MTSQTVIQGKFIFGSKSVVGDPRRKWEDRVYVGEVHRSNDDTLIVGIVADGVGSADFGARGAQLAIDTVLTNLQDSLGNDIPALLDGSMAAANTAVFLDNQKNDGNGLTTLVVALIYKDRCFVGNVGDSRAYWIHLPADGKSGRVLQLTRDHNYYNVYGGDKNSPEANIVVNAIGKKAKVQVDCGFYLKKNATEPDDLERSYQLGLAGLPLKPGDTIMLCSDGLIKNNPVGMPYTKSEEILDAIQSEYQPDRAAIKMVSSAEGRRPDDNVSVVTIQYLSPQVIKEMKSHSEQAQRMHLLIRFGVSVLVLFALILISSLSYKVISDAAKPTSTPVFITATLEPTLTPTQPIPAGKARVDQVNGGEATVKVGQYLDPGTEIFANDAGIQIVVGEQSGKAGVMYWQGGAGTVDFDAMSMKPVLKSGAIYIQPGSGSAEVYFSQPDIVASVNGSRMIVEVKGNEILVYCFEGKCRLDVGLEGKTIPVGSFISYNTITQQWNPPSGATEMTYEERWDWNVKCNYCMGFIVPSPTPTLSP